MSHSISQLQSDFLRGYKSNLEVSVGENTPFAIVSKLLLTKFKDKTITGKEQTAQLMQSLLTMSQAIYTSSAQGSWTTIQLALNNEIAEEELANKKEIANNELNARKEIAGNELDVKRTVANAQARTESSKQNLLQAQARTESSRPSLISAQSWQLKAQEKVKLLNAVGQIVFGYATGGVDVPSGLMRDQENAFSNAYSWVN